MGVHPSIRIEGGLLGPDVFDELRAGDLPGQQPIDFATPAPVAAAPASGDRVGEARPACGGTERRPARHLGDAIAEAFADARRLWTVFGHRRERIRAGDPGTGVTRDAWVVPFLGLLDYELSYNRRAHDVDGVTFTVSHRAGASATSPPVHVVGVGQDLGRAPSSGRPRLAPHALLQEYLNRTEALWGVVTNGRTLRLLRDCASVRRQAYVEFDLPGMLEEQRFADFEALYRLLHRTRLPRDASGASGCLLERYYAHGVEQGGRVRERLREGVEVCLVRLAAGFLDRPENAGLRRRAAPDGAVADPDHLPAAAFYRALLTLVYRLLFLLVAEDRGLLGASGLYAAHYGVGRLRRRLDRPSAETGGGHDDLWQSLRVLWRVLASRLSGCASASDRVRAVLGLRVCDPACGSGHFLLAASRRLGLELARIRTGETAPAPERVREAVRDVVSQSIYGVDRNPLAVDLCRVALWIESHAAGRPLTFLDHRVRCGDSLAGVLDVGVLASGVPDAAFAPLSGDDREAARRTKARNRREREAGQRRLPWDGGEALAGFSDLSRAVGAIADESPEAVRRKRTLFEGRYADAARRRLRQACDLWSGAFFQALRSGERSLTTAPLADHLDGAGVDPRDLALAESLSAEHRFFHWPLEFPEVFDDRAAGGPGFDVVLGNPPWERIKLQEKEFFTAATHASPPRRTPPRASG